MGCCLWVLLRENRRVGFVVLQDREDHVQHLVGHMGERNELVLAAISLSLVDVGEERITSKLRNTVAPVSSSRVA